MRRGGKNRERDKCIFCGEAANSGEHVWPKWSHALMPPFRGGHIQLTLEAPVTRDIMSRIYERHRQGSVAKVAIRRVCRVCNNGWMGDYEEQARATLTAMMAGKKVALDAGALQLLREYFTFKLMVLDWTARDPVFSQEERHAFLSKRSIPSGLQLVMAYCPDAAMHSYYRTHFVEASDAGRIEQHETGRKNVKSFAVGFGGIFLFALCIRDKAADLTLEPLPGFVQLAPPTLDLIHWPPFLSIDRALAERVASSLGALKTHKRVTLVDDRIEIPPKKGTPRAIS